MRAASAAALCLAAVGLFAIGGAGPAAGDKRPFEDEVSKLPEHLRKRMSGVSWRRGCPVPFRKLRLLHVAMRRAWSTATMS